MRATYSHKPSNIANHGGFTRFCGKMRERTIEFPHPVDWMEEGKADIDAFRIYYEIHAL